MEKYPVFLSVLILIFFTFFIYFPSLFSSFCLDDAIIFSASYPKTLQDSPYLLIEPVRCRVMNYYRPVTFLSFILDYTLWENNPAGYHLSNIILAAWNSCLVFLFARLFLDDKQSLLAACLFVFYPGHSEAVLGIYNRSQMLSSLFNLMALLCFNQFVRKSSGHKKWLLLSAFCTLAGCMSKESSLVIPFLSLLLFYYGNPEGKRWKLAFCGCIFQGIACGIYWILRYYALGTLAVHEVDPFFPSGTIYFNASKVLFHYLLFAFFPYPLSHDYPWEIVGFHGSGIVFPILILVSAWFFYKKPSRLYLFAFFFFFLNLVPVLHIVPLQIAFAERFLYSAYPGICILWVLFFKNFRNRSFLFLLLFIMALITFQRCFDWKDNDTLWAKTMQTMPQSYRAYIYSGSQHIRKQEYEKGLQQYEEALKRKPNRQNLLIIEYNKAIAFRSLQEPDKAKEHLKKALTIHPYHIDSLILSGDIALEEKQQDIALLYYQRAYDIENSFSPRYFEVIEKIARIFALQKNYQKAILFYEKALLVSQDKPDLYPKLAFLYIQEKNFAKAKECLEKAPKEEYTTLYIFSLFYEKSGDPGKAQQYLQKAQKYKKN
mgnify:CR=1 FL=1